MRTLCGPAWSLIDKPRVLVGDFNLHSPMWDAATINTTREAQEFVDWLDNNDLTTLNNPEEPTWLVRHLNSFRTSVLDLFAISPDVPETDVQEWCVNYEESAGSDHFPISWKSSRSLIPPPAGVMPYIIDSDAKDRWSTEWINIVDSSPALDLVNDDGTTEYVENAATALIESFIAASVLGVSPNATMR